MVDDILKEESHGLSNWEIF